MKKPNQLIFLLTILLAFNIATVKAQQKFATEADLKKEANTLFENDEFDKAFPLYSQLTSIYRKDPDYNYRLGVCMIYSFEDKEKPIRFLEYASTKQEVDKEVLYYLAKAYHLNYRFDDAINKYKEYKKVASSAKATKLQVDRQIEMCKNGKLLLRNLSDLLVTEKKEMSREDFFRAYDVTGLGGKLLMKPEDKQFKSSLDKKKKETSVIFSSSTSSQIFFSSYGDDVSKGKDIYTIKRKDNGEWTTPQNLRLPINTEYDEDFPFLHPNGKVLYFCSKGHNSMGGYDIFKSTWNEATFTWGNAVNLDFPINTPDDDILYVTDLQEKQAYFASARSSTTGKIEVYHINVDRKAIDLSLITGTVMKTGEDAVLDLKIVVKDLNNNSIVGIYNTSPVDGSYTMKLPNGGKYLFTIETPSLATQSEVVVLPVQHEFKPIVQEISLTPKKDKLVVKTIIEGTGDDSYMLATNFLKEKARMEVNVSDAINYSSRQETGGTSSQNSGNTTTANTSNTANSANTTAAKQGGKPPRSKLSNVDLLKVVNDDTKELETSAKDAKEQADIALNYANQKNQMAETKSKEVSQLLIDANKISDVTKKQAIISQANEKNALAQQLNEETASAFNLAKKLELVAEAKKKEADLSKQYAKDLGAAMKAPNAEEAIAKLDEQAKKLEALNKENPSTTSIVASLKLDQENKEKELAKTQRGITDTRQEITDNESIIAGLKADEAKARKDDLKQGLAKQIAELTEDNKGLQKELALKTAKAEQLEKDVEGIKNQSDLVKSVVEDSKTGTSEAAAASVANVDKTKLEQKLNDLAKTTTENTNSIAAGGAPVNGTTVNPTAPSTTTAQPPVAANTTQPATNSTTAAQPPVATNTTQPTTNNQQPTTNTTQPAANNSQPTTNNQQPTANATQPVATNTTQPTANNQQPTTTQPTIAQPTTTQPTTNNSQPTTNAVTLESINKKYEEEIATKIKITNEVEREQAKSNVLITWNKAVDDYIVKLKEQLAATKDPEEKKLVAKKITDSEKASSNLKVQTIESIAKVESLKKQEAAVAAANAANVTQPTANATQPTSNNSNPITNNQQPTTNNQQPTTNNSQPTTNNSQPTTNNSQPTTNNQLPTTNSSQPTTSTITLESINKKYEEEIATKNKIANEVEREQAKSSVLITWNKAVDEYIVKLKEQLAATKDPEEKKLVAKKITDSEKASGDLKVQTTESIAKVETLKKQQAAVVAANTANATQPTANATQPTTNNSQLITNNQQPTTNNQQPIATNTTQPTTNNTQLTTNATQPTTNNTQPTTNTTLPSSVSTSSINLKFQGQLNEANKMKKELDREQAKLNILRNWNKAIDDNIVKLNSELNATADAQEKAAIAKKITDAEKVSKDLKNQTTESVAKVETLKNPLPPVATNTTQPTTINQPPTTNNTQPTTNNTQPITNNVKPTTNNQQPTANNQQPTTNNQQPATNNQQPTTNTAVSLASLNEKYVAELKSADKITNPVEREQSKTEVLKTWNKEIDNNIAKQKEELKNTADPEERKLYAKIIGDAEKLSKEIAAQTQQKALKVENLKKVQNAAIATNAPSSSNETLTTNPDNNNNGNTVGSTTTNNTTATVVLAPNEVFEKKNAPVYSSKKPIPVDEKIPEGLVFKVQIGAFAKPIPQDLFEGIRPITGETTPNGYIRYTAGMFVKFSSAQNAKDQIKGFGYKDAFVVAFLDGKRISMNEAFAMMGTTPTNLNSMQSIAANATQQPPNTTQPTTNNNQQTTNATQPTTNNQQPITNATQPTTSNLQPTTNATQPTTNATQPTTSNQQPVANETNHPTNNTNRISPNAIQPEAINSTIPATTTTNVPVAPGQIIYTVQIGVFSQTLPEAKLKNVPPVTTETTPNGYIRYNTGSFTSPKQAKKTKDAVVNAGFKDAFVTAYNKGKRITVAEAKQLETEGQPATTTTTTIVTANNSTVVPPVAPAVQNNVKLTDMAKETNLKIAANLQQPSSTTLEPVANNSVPETITTLPITAQEPIVSNVVPPTTNSQQSMTNTTQPITNNQQPATITNNQPTTTEELPSSIEELTSNIKQLSNTNERIVIDSIEDTDTTEAIVNTNPPATNTVKPANKKQPSSITAVQPPPVEYEPEIQPNVEQLPPLPDSTKQNLMDAISKYNEISVDSGVVFKVQLGVFKEQIPLNIANSYLGLAKKGIKNYKDESGNTVYILGSFRTKEDADRTKVEIEGTQLKDSFIVAFNGGKKISLEEANKLINK